jgi:hypothetical protein
MESWLECNYPWWESKSQESMGEELNLSRKEGSFSIEHEVRKKR